MSNIRLAEASAPSTPASGKVVIYAKTDGLVYGKDDAGTETKLSNSSTVMTLMTPQTTTSGTSIDFTSIPSGTKRLTLHFTGVSTSGTSDIIVQLGDAGGFETSGYSGSVAHFAAASAATLTISSAGFTVHPSQAATNVYEGSMILTLANASTYSWIANGNFGRSDTTRHSIVAGSKSLSAELTQIRITTIGGSDTFDAGEMSVIYEA